MQKQFDAIIVGMGKTGYSCARYLTSKKLGFAMVDSRPSPPLLAAIRKDYPEVELVTGGFDPGLLSRTRQLVISPGVSLREPGISAAIAAGANVAGDIELFCREATAPVLAITGSNGKSTVTTLVAEMAKAAGLKVAAGGNLGTPALDLLRESGVDVYVIELSSFQLELVSSLNAAAAVVLNVTEDHMDRYSGMEDYRDAKARIYAGDGAMIINLDDPRVVDMQRAGRKVSGFTLTEPEGNHYGIRSCAGTRWLVKGGEKLVPAGEIKLAGEHNLANALAALALGEAIQLPTTAMVEVLRSFPGLPHRCQWVAESGGIRWYDDSKGTNVGASVAAIKGLAGRKNIVLIAGGEGKGADFSPLAAVAQEHLRAAVLIGRDAPLIEKALDPVVPLETAADMNAAVRAAQKLARKGDVVLLSPACASFDMFEDYRARGDAFQKAVLNMAGPG